MKFSCILEIECEPGIPLTYYYGEIPGWVHGNPWTITEKGKAEWDDDLYDKRWKHRKLIACLTRKEFDELIENLELRYEGTSLGMLGAPMPDGEMHLGLIPAWVWTAYAYEQSVSLFTCPIPSVKPKEGRWDKIMDVFEEVYCG